MNSDSTYDLIIQNIEEISKAFAFAYAVVDMRQMMHYLHGDRSALGLILSNKEMERLEGYALPKKRLQWLAGRFAVKTALSKHGATDGHEQPMPSIDVFNNENSAPYILQFPNLQLSISHCFPYCIGVVSDLRIGIDLEKMITPRRAMIDLFFHPNEIQGLPEPAETEAYQYMAMACWTRKEALSKLLGLGMKAGFERLDTIDDELCLKDFGGIRVKLSSSRCADFVVSIAAQRI